MSTLTLRQSTVFPIWGGGSIFLLLFGVLLSTLLITAGPVSDADASTACNIAAAACGAATSAMYIICNKHGNSSTACKVAKAIKAAACALADALCGVTSS